MTQNGQPNAETTGGRGRSRKPVRKTKSLIGSSPHREDYVRLMEEGWTSPALERYAAYRYGEQIKAATFRAYKMRKKVEVNPRAIMGSEATSPEVRVDVMGVREQLTRMQMDRIKIDVKHEKEMGKLFGTTGREIDLLSRLLDKIKEDQKDMGILPHTPTVVEIEHHEKSVEKQESMPRHRTLGEVLGGNEEQARRLVEALATGQVVDIDSRRSS